MLGANHMPALEARSKGSLRMVNTLDVAYLI